MRMPWSTPTELAAVKATALKQNADARAQNEEVERITRALERQQIQNGYAKMIERALKGRDD